MKKIFILVLLLLASLAFTSCINEGGNQMFVSIYDRGQSHITNADVSKYKVTKKVFELDVSSFTGQSDIDITTGLVFVFKDSNGIATYSGFMKNIVQDEDTGVFSFKGEDFRKIFDTVVLLDFTDLDVVGFNDFEIKEIFGITKDAVVAQATTIFTLNFTIPNDQELTINIADYTGTYFTANALSFLKIYLAYYNYYILTSFDENDLEINFEFVENTTTEEIKLNDFIFAKSSTDTKTNRTIARLKFDTLIVGEREWRHYDSGLAPAAYAAQPSSNKATTTTLIANIDIDLYVDGFWMETTGVYTNYYISRTIVNNWQYSSVDYYNLQDASNRATDTDSLDHQLPSLDPNDYDLGFCIKVIVGAVTNYFKCILNTAELPATLAVKYYELGLDNVIYETGMVDANRIYPVSTKIYISEFLAKAQFNAIWELVNSRYNDNIVLTYVEKAPLDIKDWDLYTLITVYDKNGIAKELPVAEITITQDDYLVKLGFKKTRFTDIIKEATGVTESGSVTITPKVPKVSREPIIDYKIDMGRLGNL